MNTPVISIVTPARNALPFLKETAHSILQQTERRWEWIVVSDGSTDGTDEFVAGLCTSDDRIRLKRTSKDSDVGGGAGPARNIGINSARGDYIAFVDADDIWAPEKITIQLDHMRSIRSQFCFTGYRIIAEDGTETEKSVDVSGIKSIGYEDLLRKRVTLGCSTVLVKRTFLGDRRFPPLPTGQDYALWLSLLRDGTKADLLGLPLTSYRIVAGSLSRNKLRKAGQQWRIYREVENIGLAKSVECFINYAVRAVTR